MMHSLMAQLHCGGSTFKLSSYLSGSVAHKKDSTCSRNRIWLTGRNATWFAHCRQALPTETTLCKHNGTLSFTWKSFPHPDSELEARLRKHAAAGRTQVVVYSVGPHFFNKFAEFGNATQAPWAHASLEPMYPQQWLSEFFADTYRTMSWLASLKVAMVACPIWKTCNLARRELLLRQPSHPSQRYGLHDHLRSWELAMAKYLGVPVFDAAELTLNMTPSWDRNTTSSDGPYHGWDNDALAVGLLNTIKRVCVRRAEAAAV